MTEPIVQFVDVGKSYDGKTSVIDGLHLDIRRGEFLTFLGPSGCGKTTCLMMLAGFEAPTTGDITLNGKSLMNVPPFRRNMGMVFQNYALFPHKTVFENIAFPLKHRGIPRAEIEARVAQILGMVDLAAMRDRRPAQLSGGQQQRVALARALVFKPDVVLLDEPLSALDKNLREQMQLEIKHLHDSLGMTFVFVTHDQSEALTMSDRVVIFDKGVIQQAGSPREIYDRPRNKFVAHFVGENNSLQGVIERVEGEICGVRLAGGELVLARSAEAPQPGAKVTVVVRPERIVILPGSEPRMNPIEVAVKEIIYSGDHVKFRMTLSDRSIVVAKMLTNSRTFPDSAVGDKLTIGWRAEDCFAFAVQ